MESSSTGITRRSFVAAALGAALASSAAGGLAMAADDHSTPDGHIIVHKYLEDGDTTKLSDNPDASEQGMKPAREATRVPLAGVTFAARRVYSAAEQQASVANGVKPTTFVDHVTYSDGETYYASKLGENRSDQSADFSKFAFSTEDGWFEATTDESGKADIALGQVKGSFVLVENESTSTAAGSVTLIEPCVVNVPMTDADGNLVYTVTASPKNKEPDRQKKIELRDNDGASSHLSDEATYAKGDTVDYVVDYEAPANVDNITSVVFVDQIDEHLTYVGSTAAVSSSPDFATSAADVTFATPGDFAVDYTGNTLTVTLEGSAIKSKLIDAGLMGRDLTGAVVGASGGSDDKTKRTRQLRLSFRCLLNASGDDEAAAGDYPNTCKVQLRNGSSVTHEVETNDTHVYNLKVTVNKKDPDGKPLGGAKFGIADTLEHAKANPPVLLSESMAGETGSTASMNDDGGTCTWDGTDTGVTADDGTLTFAGLPFRLRGDGSALTTYWVREIEAPDGYGIVEEPVRVDIGDLDSVRAANFALSVDVTDSPKGWLPNTGGVKSYAAVVGGAAVVAAGVGAAAAARRHAARQDDGAQS